MQTLIEYGILKSSGIRSLQLKAPNSISQSDIQDKLEWAFEEGYKLGKSDGNEGIFIDLGTIVEQFIASMSIYEESD
jgi:hypothetical protein